MAWRERGGGKGKGKEGKGGKGKGKYGCEDVKKYEDEKMKNEPILCE